MEFDILATDYDGTLAWNGKVEDSTLNALARLREAGKHTILVTGREIHDLREIFTRFDLFDSVVAENGGLLYDPRTDQKKPLCPPVSREFVETLRQRNVTPLAVGRTIVATQEVYQTVVKETIERLKLPLEIRLNKGSVMVLPAGVNKGSGLRAALREHGWEAQRVVAIGDGENDHDLFEAATFGVAVGNAVPELKAHAGWVTAGAHGEGVEELIQRWLAGALAPAPAPENTALK